MATNMRTWLLRSKRIVIVAGFAVLVAAWWAFRPEKLWINEKVDEPAPFASSLDPQPLYTGRLESKAHQVSGRATIYKGTGGKRYLSLTDFTTPNGPDVHVALARSNGQDLERIDLGTLKGNQGERNYDLPATADLTHYSAVVIYSERSHATLGYGKLEPF